MTPDELRESLPVQPLDDAEAFADEVTTRWSGARRTRRVARVGLALAAVVLLVLGMQLWPVAEAPESPAVATTAPAGWADDRVLASHGATYTLSGSREDRRIALASGRVYCEVEDRAPGERFTVAVGEAVVEVTGTRFGVEATEGILQAVWVDEGEVLVRRPVGDLVLRAGERWTLRRAPAAPPTAPVLPLEPPEAPPLPEPVAEAVPVTDGVALERGLAALDRGEPHAAAAAFAEETGALREDGLFWRGVALHRAGEVDAAIAAFENLLAAFPRTARSGDVHCMLGRLHRLADAPEAARPHFEAAAASAAERAARCGEEGLR